MGLTTNQTDSRVDAKRRLTFEELGETCSIDEAAQLLGISRMHVYASAHNGELPVLKLGRRFVVSTKRLRELIEQGSPTGADAGEDGTAPDPAETFRNAAG